MEVNTSVDPQVGVPDGCMGAIVTGWVMRVLAKRTRGRGKRRVLQNDDLFIIYNYK